MGEERQGSLGQRLRAIRRRDGWTLRELSQRIGIPVSTLSKVERGELTLDYPQLQQMLDRLNLQAADLFGEISEGETPGGWRSIERAGSVAFQTLGEYECGYPCAELLHKRMVPVLIKIKSARVNGSAFCGAGDQYLYVLAGSVEVNTQLYAAVVLRPGDSMYLDSRMEHTYSVVEGCGEATALLVCAEPPPSRAQGRRQELLGA